MRSLLSLSLAGILSPIKKIFASPAIDARYIRQIVSDDDTTGRTIMWHSSGHSSALHLDWREPGAKREHRVDATDDYFVDDGESVFIHSSYIKGLKPGHTYEYAISTEGGKSPWYTFRTDDGQSMKAIILSDSQCADDYATWSRTVSDAVKYMPDADALMVLGDLVDNGEDSYQWRRWFDMLTGIAERMTLVPVMGNHECYDIHWGNRIPAAYLNFFDVPGNGSTRFPRYYYSFDYGPIHFVVLNNCFEELDALRGGLLAEEMEWLRADLDETQQKWRVVLMHRDIIDYDASPLKIESFAKKFAPIFEEGHVDIVIAAHIHSYRRRPRLKNFHRNKAGIIYINDGIAGDQHLVPPLFPWDEVTAPKPETTNYMTLEATMAALHFQCVVPGKGVVDDFTVKK